LLVVQTFSKSRNLAGLRLGWAMGHARLIEGLQRIKNSFNSYPVGRLTSEIGIAALGDEDYFQQCRRRIIASRERVDEGLRSLGFEVLPSRANFVFARPPGRDAGEIYRALKAAGILVRYFDRPRIDQYLRISIGSEDECDVLLAALKTILG
jgi:histidinol-phosphate aminotransferase